MSAWTVVTRRAGRGPFRKTGFAGTWAEADRHAQSFPGDDLDVWIVGADDTSVLVNGRRVGIAPTPTERAAAKADRARLDAIAAELLGCWTAEYVVSVARSVVTGFDSASRVDAARALAAAGWDRAAVARRMS